MTDRTDPLPVRKRIALIAHDNCKADLLEWARYNRETLSWHELFGTGTTGGLLATELDLPVHRYRSGPLGGDQQVGALHLTPVPHPPAAPSPSCIAPTRASGSRPASAQPPTRSDVRQQPRPETYGHPPTRPSEAPGIVVNDRRNAMGRQATDLDALGRSPRTTTRLTDPETGARYEYRVLDPISGHACYELCASFAAETGDGRGGPRGSGDRDDFWWHDHGRQCFTIEADQSQ